MSETLITIDMETSCKINQIRKDLENLRVNGILNDQDCLSAIDEIKNLNLHPRFGDLSASDLTLIRMHDYIYSASINMMLNLARKKMFVGILKMDDDLVSLLKTHWINKGFQVCSSSLQTEETDNFRRYEITWL